MKIFDPLRTELVFQVKMNDLSPCGRGRRIAAGEGDFSIQCSVFCDSEKIVANAVIKF